MEFSVHTAENQLWGAPRIHGDTWSSDVDHRPRDGAPSCVTTHRSGKRVKTRRSQRAVPVHPELIKLGFLDYLQDVRRTQGDDG
jgi:hypothetical protein